MSDVIGESAATGGEHLFDALCALEARLRDNAAGLPQRGALSDTWSGLLFRVGELSLLAPLDEIGEVLNVPSEITPIPATKEWVFGIANNRGTLLPMFDLCAFVFDSPTNRSIKNRLLVVRRDEFPVGLLVADVAGIRHFDTGPQAASAPGLPGPLEPFVSGSIELDTDIHPVFSARQLTRDARFNLTGT